jgi:hypothetical protein
MCRALSCEPKTCAFNLLRPGRSNRTARCDALGNSTDTCNVFPDANTLMRRGERFSRMSSIWFFRAYGPVIVEFVGVVLVAVGARGLAWRGGSRNGSIRSQYNDRSSANALAATGWSRGTVKLGDQITSNGGRRAQGPNILQATEASSNGGPSSPGHTTCE